ncbi:MAG: transposase [Spirochaetales bacterium]|nr:transposase [Spirochaetales bacterium]
MAEIKDYKDLLRKPKDEELELRIGKASDKNIDKTGVFYHVITKSAGGDIFLAKGAGEYRHNMLCNLCEERGITLLFSVTMPNHTHDVFLTSDWKTLSEVLRILNTNISKYIRKNAKAKFDKKTRILRRNPIYIVIRDIVYLFTMGKYAFDNPAYLREEGKYVPYDCFWTFKTGHMLTGYDEKIYLRLFGLTPGEIYEVYSKKTMKEVVEYAKKRFSDWTPDMTQRFFYRR